MLFLCWTLNVRGQQERSVLLSCSSCLNGSSNNKHHFVHYVKLEVNMQDLTKVNNTFFYFALPTVNAYQAWLCSNNDTENLIENTGVRKYCGVWGTLDFVAKKLPRQLLDEWSFDPLWILHRRICSMPKGPWYWVLSKISSLRKYPWI